MSDVQLCPLCFVYCILRKLRKVSGFKIRSAKVSRFNKRSANSARSDEVHYNSVLRRLVPDSSPQMSL